MSESPSVETTEIEVGEREAMPLPVGLRPFVRGDPRAKEAGRKGGQASGAMASFMASMRRTARSVMLEASDADGFQTVRDAQRLLALCSVAILKGTLEPRYAHALARTVECWLRCDAAARDYVELERLRERVAALEGRRVS